MDKRTVREDKEDLKGFDYTVIAYISLNNLCTAKEISHSLKVDKSYLYPCLNKLEELGVLVTTTTRPKYFKLIQNEYVE